MFLELELPGNLSRDLTLELSCMAWHGSPLRTFLSVNQCLNAHGIKSLAQLQDEGHELTI